jgi:succinyl-CoA synthetase beta subunit
MRIHEYQAKQILADFGVPVPPGKVATDASEAAELMSGLPGAAAIIKAQSYGYRPKGRRTVGLVRRPEEAAAIARRLIGRRPGTDPIWARPITKVLVEQYVEVQSAFYLAVVMDPALAKPVMLAGRKTASADRPTDISREVIDPRFGTLSFQWRKIARALDLKPAMLPQVTAVASGLYRAFIECECIEAEIATLGLTAAGELIALEARMRFDDAALFRHGEIAALRDPAEFSDTENTFADKRMRYVALGGRIGCAMFDTASALALVDRLAEAGARPGGILYFDASDSAEKIAYGITCLLREETFRAVIVGVPRDPGAASRLAAGLRIACPQTDAAKPLVALAVSDAAFAAMKGVDGSIRVVRSGPEAAETAGRD